MKKILTYITILLSTGQSQFDLYPVTDFFGGGIGYSPMYINVEKFPATDLLKSLGLNPDQFDAPFVVHGGEGLLLLAMVECEQTGGQGTTIHTLTLTTIKIKNDINNKCMANNKI